MTSMELVNIKKEQQIFSSFSEEQELEQMLSFLRSVPCQVLKTGFRQVETVYYFCSCDPEMKEPKCEECKQRCHKDH